VNYLDLNKKTWDAWAELHVNSDFYDIPSFLAGENSLYEIELSLLGDINKKKLLHLQCHFGQDTLSLARLGADVTGVDLSEKAISIAKSLAVQLNIDAKFINCDIFDLKNHLQGQFDIVFTSYGTIGWLPELSSWAQTISHFLKPGGTFVFVEFHPVIWMFDEQIDHVQYPYFVRDPIIETVTGSYAAKESDVVRTHVTWNHSLAEVIQNLISNGIDISLFSEYDYSPIDCFPGTEEYQPGRFRIKKYGNSLPMVYAIKGVKI